MNILSFLCGLAFGFGVLLSGMTDAHKVLAFLDANGAWDPSLLLVMASAVLVAAPLLQLAGRRDRALLGAPVTFPARFGITPQLLAGSAIFGIGWGIDGLCPGPSLAMLGACTWQEGLFCSAMLCGMLAFEAWQRRSLRSPATAR